MQCGYSIRFDFILYLYYSLVRYSAYIKLLTNWNATTTTSSTYLQHFASICACRSCTMQKGKYTCSGKIYREQLQFNETVTNRSKRRRMEKMLHRTVQTLTRTENTLKTKNRTLYGRKWFQIKAKSVANNVDMGLLLRHKWMLCYYVCYLSFTYFAWAIFLMIFIVF